MKTIAQQLNVNEFPFEIEDPNETFTYPTAMKSSLALFTLLLFIVSCTSSQQLLEQGQLDEAVTASVEKLQENPENTDQLQVLTAAYERANERDKTLIKKLNFEETGENLKEVSELYDRLQDRQEKIMTLPSALSAQFEVVNYDDQFNEAKYAAAENLYSEGQSHIQKGDRQAYRKAWTAFNRASEIYPGYKDVDQKIEETRKLGTAHALFVAENNSEVKLPEDFTSELSEMISEDLDLKWLKLYTNKKERSAFDHRLVLDVSKIIISPERIDRETDQKSKEIEDGFIQRRDSLGNIIRIPNKITVKATLLTITKTKSAIVDGSLNFYEYSTNKLVRSEELSEEIVFKNKFYEFYGDDRALSANIRVHILRDRTDAKPRITINDSRGLIYEDRKEIPFPSNDQLLIFSTELLNEKARKIIRSLSE